MRLLATPIFLIATSFLVSSSALANWTTTLGVGVAIPSIGSEGVEVDGDSGYSFSASVGWRLNDLIQWDTAEIAYSSANQFDWTLGAFTSSSLAIGTGVRVGSFGAESKFHPYASFGIGGARVDFEQGGISWISEWGFEWNLGAGVLYDFSDEMSLGARYRYRSSSYDEAYGIAIPEINVNIHTITFEIAFGG